MDETRHPLNREKVQRPVKMPFRGSGIHEVVLLGQFIGFFGTSRAEFVGNGLLSTCFQLMEQRGENPPSFTQFIGSDKVHLRAHKHVQDQSLIGLGQSGVRIAVLVGEVQFGFLHGEAHAGCLVHHLAVDRLIGLDTENQLVSLGSLAKDVSGDILELKANLGLLLVQGFPRSHDEGHAFPSLAIDSQDTGSIRGCDRVLWDTLIVLVTQALLLFFGIGITHILPKDDILDHHRGNKFEDLHFFVANIVGSHCRWFVHGSQR
ncbi:hypothetical protein TCAL_16210 [Tigriopus californicus]|uniref:Uncharacterized protein n=1 Tax=Tigriopus californicus TaxID=6832 RepID=A0A553P351_TIGCA|nr:hypothetical protein TCAL_16210 [Tigriopus californicus]